MEKFFVKINNESYSIFLIPMDDSFINKSHIYDYFIIIDWD